jgi:predicted nucleic acid-binding protein
MLRTGDHEVIVPEPVIAEIEGHGEDDPTVKAIRELDWLIVAPGPSVPMEIAVWELGPGESAVLALALGEPDVRVVIDDRDARRCARSLAIPIIGTLGLVLLAKEAGRIAAARPIVERLRESGMYLSDRVVNETLGRVGE